jgi:hypothetical protein
MKYILFFAGILIVCASFFVQDRGAPILWQKKSLRWRNFRDVPDSVGPHAKSLAVTSSRLEQRYYRVGNELHFIVAAWFNPNKSWVRDWVASSQRMSDQVLNHEQHHFDMCELYARKIRRYLSKAVFTEATYEKEIPELFKTFHTQYRAEQNKYDSELKDKVYRLDEWTESIDIE